VNKNAKKILSQVPQKFLIHALSHQILNIVVEDIVHKNKKQMYQKSLIRLK
jgi:hypothetical protein